ncbi:hypothetical protein HNR42_000724 [Deinobacterium chartae]|uniref:Outer membrane protein beta-barrel domain-containing protein n=1 Tax=Deinobacterium chartae TaxID=521158 RepID=A0A841HYL3_9DEIO|nr:hypothetical protein [Deinobacterium chartae]MBB6097310.1 hypothetical protein [Deinobacterium chartae]
MKKAVFVLGLGLALSGAAMAQPYSVTLGGTFGNPNGFSFGFTANNLWNLGGNAVDGRIIADLTGSGAVFNFDALFNLPTDTVNFYAGPSLGFTTGGTFLAGLVGGAEFALTNQFDLFAEATLKNYFGSGFAGGFRFGVAYTF